jgi:tyrosine-protein kinase Etk/Wzc
MGEFVGWARSGFDLVVFDTAPTLAVTDAILIGRRADGTVLCLRAGYVERRDVRACRDRLAQAGVRVLGAVLNRARAHDGSYPNGYGGYGSYGGYGTERDSAGDAPAQTGAA